VCFFGDVVSSTEPWDRVAVVRYPTRKSFVDMQARPDFQARHVHKAAGMDRTIIMATVPVDTLPAQDAQGLTLIEAWHADAPSADPGATEFAVEGTVIGDGRTWQVVRFSTATGAVTAAGDPGRQAIVVRPAVCSWT
jgi:hypothetical protein